MSDMFGEPTHTIKSASARSPSVEYVLNRIPVCSSTCFTSLADSDLPMSASHRHLGSTL